MSDHHDERNEITLAPVPGVRAPGESAGSEGDADRIARGDGTLSSGGTPRDDAGRQDQPAESIEAQDVASKLQPILWHSNAPWVGTGYGTQTSLFAPLVADLGYPLAFSAFHGLRGRRLGWVAANGRPFVVYPGGRDSYGNDVLGAHSRHWFAENGSSRGMVVFLSDPWVLRAELAGTLNLLSWCPVDHSPAIPKTVQWFQKSGAYPVAMSRFGQEELLEAGIKNVDYVPHGFDPEVFKPAERWEARRALGVPEDAFVVGMVAANLGIPSRKSFAQALQAFAEFRRTRTDAVLYLHTALQHPLGENLAAMCKALSIKPYLADQYGLVLGTPESVVSATLNSFDVLLNPAQGEGFGVPLIEAQACGTPCIVTDFSAMPEVASPLVGNWAVGGQKVWTGFESWQVAPNVEEILACLEIAYAETVEERLTRRQSVFHHAQEYRAVPVTEKYWKPALERAAEEFRWRGKQMRQFSE